MRRAVLLLWICFLTRGVFYSIALPLWEGFDEYAHFGHVQNVAAGRWLAAPRDRATREVERSTRLVPMPWVLRSGPPPHETHESYWKLPVEERAMRERELAEMPPSLAREEAIQPIPSESQQPPLSYWLMAVLYKVLAACSLSARVLALRLLNLLLASFAVPAAWMAARRVFADDRVAVAVAAVVAVFPELMFDAARVSNSALAIALFSALTVLCLDVADDKRRAALPLGAVLGLGLLTKAFFLAAVPAAAALLIWKQRRRAFVPLALGALIAGWWYVRNLGLTGSLSTALQDAGLRHLTLLDRLRRVPDVNWFAALDSTFFSHIWFGGWSFLQVRAWIYHVFAAVAVVAVAGIAVAWFRRAPARRHLAVLLSLYILFCMGIAYHVLITFLANGISSSAGWYLCAVIVPEMLLAAAGLRAIFGDRAFSMIVAAFTLLDLYGMLFVALPYYTGLIGHKPNGFLEAFYVQQFSSEMLQRLTLNKPIGSVVVAVTGFMYIAATVSPVLISWAKGKRT